jgi:Ca-activated chloride channel family protein
MPRRTLLPFLAAVVLAGAGTAEARPPAAPPGIDATPPLRLVPPAEPHGRVRIDALATAPGIDRVVFFLDGQEAGADAAAPFGLELELDPSAGERHLRAEAFDRDGRSLGEDTLTVGAEARPFEVAIRRLDPATAPGADGSEGVEVELAVSLPSGARLERVELHHNRTPVARLEAPPFRVRLDLPAPAPEDYLRAVAVLEDGTAVEDARPLAFLVEPDGAARPTGAGSAFGEHVEVRLLELYAVATDRRGRQVRGLGPEDFRVLLDGRALPVEHFREAHQVPLALGLLVDSSDSMGPIMEDTREAAARFLERTLAPGDRTFLVDVDTRPRLAHAATGEPAELALSFEGLAVGGDTALYDSIALGLLELRNVPGRRALVVLTDGRDVGSQLDLGRCRRLAGGAGIPVYVLSLGGLAEGRTRPDRSLRLRAFADETGGRLYPVVSFEDLDRAYEEIESDLRSQYVLGVATGRALTGEELARLEVRAERRGLRVRAAARSATP